MLNIFRRRDMAIRVLVGSILVLVSISMVITLIPGLTGMAVDPSVNAVVAEVGGEEITAWELQQNLFQITRRNRIPPEMMPLYTSQVLDQMVWEKASLREASRLGLRVTESELRKQLRWDPGLFPGGTFVGQQQYENMVAGTGLTVAQFERSYRQRMLNQKLFQLVTDPLTVLPEEVRETFHNENEKVILNYVFLNPEDFQKTINPTEAALEDYYEKNKDRYQIPEKRSVKILYVENQKLRESTAIPEAEIKKYYEENKDVYRIEERVLARHILLRAPQNDAAKVEQAKAKAAELLEKIKEGSDFAVLAKENSQDKATADKGGLLGWITRGQTVPEFERVAFRLETRGISEPVQTLFGIHIINVLTHEPPRLRTLEEVKPEIEKILVEGKVRNAAVQVAEQAGAALRDSPDDIEAVAEQHQGVVIAPPPLAQGDTVARIQDSQRFLQEVFALEKGQVSVPIEGTDGYAVALLLDVFPAHRGELQEVEDQVKTGYIAEQARKKALSKAEDLSKLLEQQKKKDLKRAARALGLTVQTSPAVARQGTIPSLGDVAELGPEAFNLEAGEVAGPVSVGGGQVVYQVESRQPAKEEDLEAQQGAIRERLLNQKRQVAFAVFQDNLRERLTASGEIKIDSDALDQMTAAYR